MSAPTILPIAQGTIETAMPGPVAGGEVSLVDQVETAKARFGAVEVADLDDRAVQLALTELSQELRAITTTRDPGDTATAEQSTAAQRVTPGATREQYIAFWGASPKTRNAAALAHIAIRTRARADRTQAKVAGASLAESLRTAGKTEAQIARAADQLKVDAAAQSRLADDAERQAAYADFDRVTEEHDWREARRGTVMVDVATHNAEERAYAAYWNRVAAEQRLARMGEYVGPMSAEDVLALGMRRTVIGSLGSQGAEVAAVYAELDGVAVSKRRQARIGNAMLDVEAAQAQAEVAIEERNNIVNATTIAGEDGVKTVTLAQEEPRVFRRGKFGIGRKKWRIDKDALAEQSRLDRIGLEYDAFQTTPHVRRKAEININLGFTKFTLAFGKVKLRKDRSTHLDPNADREIRLPAYAQYVFDRPDLPAPKPRGVVPPHDAHIAEQRASAAKTADPSTTRYASDRAMAGLKLRLL